MCFFGINNSFGYEVALYIILCTTSVSSIYIHSNMCVTRSEYMPDEGILWNIWVLERILCVLPLYSELYMYILCLAAHCTRFAYPILNAHISLTRGISHRHRLGWNYREMCTRYAYKIKYFFRIWRRTLNILDTQFEGTVLYMWEG